jgi:hypothetical protein
MDVKISVARDSEERALAKRAASVSSSIEGSVFSIVAFLGKFMFFLCLETLVTHPCLRSDGASETHGKSSQRNRKLLDFGQMNGTMKHIKAPLHYFIQNSFINLDHGPQRRSA